MEKLANFIAENEPLAFIMFCGFTLFIIVIVLYGLYRGIKESLKF